MKTTHKIKVKGKAEQAYKKKIEPYKVPLYDYLKPCKEAEDNIIIISVILP